MVRIAGCGDIFISDTLPQDKYNGFNELSKLLKSHQIRFGNLETTIHNNEGYPTLFPGGGYAMASPCVLDDVYEYGFNLLNIANNHIMDYSHKGLEATLGHLKKTKFKFAGAGMNLANAASPVYIECDEARVSLISATSSFHDSDAAGAQGFDMPGRPGVNPVRHLEIYQISEEQMRTIQTIATKTGINDYRNWGIQNGYVLPTEYFKLLNLHFKLGDDVRKISIPDKHDLFRICNAIEEAKRQSDCVIFSFHGHQMNATDDVPDDFIISLCHSCADAGSNIIFCHGAHVLRGIEIYRNCAIFYGLGDFILKNELQLNVPVEFYQKYDIPSENQCFPGLAMDIRSQSSNIGLCAISRAWESIIASIEFDNRIIQIKLYPITLHYELPRSRRGWPELAPNRIDILENLSRLSSKYNTKILIEEGVGLITLN